MRKICIIAENYPTKSEPSFPFVQQLASSLSNIDCECSVIAPQSITKVLLKRTKRKPVISVDKDHEREIRVIRPWIVTFSNTSNKVLLKISDWFWKKGIAYGLKHLAKPDVLYCYFWHIGLKTSMAVKNINIPIFVQASECELTVSDYMKTEENLKRISGVICASSKNYDESVEAGLVLPEKTCIAVNGYRRDEFYPIKKNEARRKLGIKEDLFIVSFVGGFIPRKGIKQLCDALNRFDDVYSIFIGSGHINPNCKNILFTGSVPHIELVNYLNCSDVFVLPTEAEGCCNAIIEAIACGLPVISSNKKFNNEIIDQTSSIRINEQSADEIYYAIKELKEDPVKREQLSIGALKKSEQLTIEKRALAIKNYIFKNLVE